ncbi:hypothetical protein AeMF1_015641 [Aphanomyces euteiches]|nr:hypothetical protein AeMF1_015641 [Aphanomyces euteiches]KAH9194316.1 hypothetical protein AeNC1_003704 [Aphanomyces euteiches]
MKDHAPVVVLDAANIATIVRGAVRIQRLLSAFHHFEELGIRCIAFAPGYWIKTKAATPRTARTLSSAEMELDQKFEMSLIQQLVLAEKVVLTPPQAHDDLFIIDYAMKHNGFVVTNDMFRDHVATKMNFHKKELTEAWVKTYCITFTFVGTEFLPSAQHIHALLKPPPKETKEPNQSAKSKGNIAAQSFKSTEPMKKSPLLTIKTSSNHSFDDDSRIDQQVANSTKAQAEPVASPRKAQRARPSTPHAPSRRSKRGNSYKTLEDCGSSSTSNSSDDESNQTKQKNVLADWQTLQQAIAQHRVSNNQDGDEEHPSTQPKEPPEVESNNDVKAPLSPTQKKRLRRRMMAPQKKPTMVYRGKYALVAIGAPLILGLVLKMVLSAATLER